MELCVRRQIVVIDETREVSGRKASPPLRKIAAIAVVENPLVDRFEPDLGAMVDASVALGYAMAQVLDGALSGIEVQSYGKGGIVGLRGEQEHANALLTTAFADPFRQRIAGAAAWISSVTKVAAPGTVIDVPMNSVRDVYVRSHYDAMSICLPGAPMPDEIVVVFCVATRGRISARVGGLSYKEALERTVTGTEGR